MQAVVFDRYGPPEVLRITEVAKPIPKDKEILVKVFATTVHRGDVRMRSFDVPRWQWLFARLYLGVRKPKRPILGMELAGEVVQVGSAVSRFEIGDKVFASTLWSDFGGYAEYKCLPEDTMVTHKPSNLSYEEAAAIPCSGLTALRILRMAKIQPGQKVLIYGASGSGGSFAVQLAKSYGAEVTGVCSTSNLEMVKGLGADRVIDYTQEDLPQQGILYDVFFDAVAKYPPKEAKKILAKGGTYLNVHKHDGTHDKKKPFWHDLDLLKDLCEEGKLRAAIDRCYRLDQLPEAHQYVETGHKRGNVVVNIAK